MRALPAVLLAVGCLLAGCAAPGLRAPAVAPEDEACLRFFAQADAAVDAAGVRDALATRIADFPHLRVNRLLASFRDELADAATTRFWLAQLARLDAQARAAELANLPPPALRELAAAEGREPASLAAGLAQCRARLVAADAADAARLATLRGAAVVPDDYSLALRTLGLYPLTRIPFGAGVAAFERRVADTFALPLDQLPVHGALARWALPNTPARDALVPRLAAATANPLGIPEPDAAALAALARAHAPVFEIDVVDDNDRIGRPRWPLHGPIGIDTGQPQVYFRAAHTRAGDRVLLQLVYTAWFPARPARGSLDLLAGHLDALVWRVTLAPDGAPLLFDSIHACGCYHFFFPTARVRPRPAPVSRDEWLFAPQRLPPPRPDERVVLRVAARTHYLERVRFEPRAAAAPATAYALAPDDTLRSLPHPAGGRRSMFGPDGLVAGSARGERFLFWPMGLTSAGAMRQWGRHATAFVGRRHFDAARLIDERFVVLEAPADRDD